MRLIILLLFVISSCTPYVIGTGIDLKVDLKKEIEKSIIDGFYTNDTI